MPRPMRNLPEMSLRTRNVRKHLIAKQHGRSWKIWLQFMPTSAHTCSLCFETNVFRSNGSSHEKIFQRFTTRRHLDDSRATFERGLQYLRNVRFTLDFHHEMLPHPARRHSLAPELANERIARIAARHFDAAHLRTQELPHPAAHDHFASSQDDDAVAQRFDVRENVRREEDRLAAFLLFEDEVAHLFSSDRIEPAHRLVQHKRLGDRPPGPGDAPPVEGALRGA